MLPAWSTVTYLAKIGLRGINPMLSDTDVQIVTKYTDLQTGNK